jgi:predicted enzyme related to lactoylglutathione lyase
MDRPVHFEIHSADPQRAIKFYESVFGWKAQKWGDQDYWLLMTGEESAPGINGAIFPRQGPEPTEGQAVNAWVCTLEVADIDQTIKKIEGAGGKVVVPKQTVPNIGTFCQCTDTEGNFFGLIQNP